MTFAGSSSTGRVSIIIPTRDSAEALRRCLRSVNAQRHHGDEVVVVDCFSGDDTRRVASELGEKVILARGTQAAARNVGIANSDGEYLLFLDSDQQLEDGVVEDCISRCARDGVDAVKIPELFVGVNFWGRCSAFWKNSMVKAWGPDGGIPRFYRRSVLRQSAYDGILRFWEDLELYQRLTRITLRRVAWCRCRVVHYEVSSLRDLVTKYLSYGRSVAGFRTNSAEKPHSSTIKLTLSTGLHVLRNPGRSPLMFFGCLFQVLLKAFCAGFGFFMESWRRRA